MYLKAEYFVVRPEFAGRDRVLMTVQRVAALQGRVGQLRAE